MTKHRLLAGTLVDYTGFIHSQDIELKIKIPVEANYILNNIKINDKMIVQKADDSDTPNNPEKNTSSLSKQEGGNHYKDYAIQPVEFCQKNGLNFIESSVIKYVTRHRSKNGAQDLKKAIHFLQILLELEYEPSEEEIESFEKEWQEFERDRDKILRRRKY